LVNGYSRLALRTEILDHHRGKGVAIDLIPRERDFAGVDEGLVFIRHEPRRQVAASAVGDGITCKVDFGRPGDLALELKSHLDGDFLVEWGEVHGHDARDDALGGVPRRWRALGACSFRRWRPEAL
jgi:hypothetical protein